MKIWSNALIEDINRGLFIGVTSEIVEAEISDAPHKVQEKYLDFLKMKPEILKLNMEAISLVDVHLRQ